MWILKAPKLKSGFQTPAFETWCRSHKSAEGAPKAYYLGKAGENFVLFFCEFHSNSTDITVQVVSTTCAAGAGTLSQRVEGVAGLTDHGWARAQRFGDGWVRIRQGCGDCFIDTPC